ncbi:GNAT family N-acetyltransferase [Roseateles sp. DAIF2]|uniref:GNAT family N-acetyltransferase n=1 Tax=Roseateles sp. DAIF2 TaxID=2714952 RepID=UPI0018A33809|nr:GNAT family N-acetyltransferase [Roseateles sp. DAIF2]QPF74857.1 GNAT family N-acetyltransferase [Roseateles sp. DAIF2]
MPSFSDLTLTTPRLLLRPLRDTDARALFAIFSDPAVMRYWSTPPWSALEQAQASIEQDRQAIAAGEALRLGLERREDRALIGTCSLFSISMQCRRAELGYGMARRAWGQAYMQEALQALLDFGFSEALGLKRIEADIDPRNQGSARTLERLGFVQEGLLRERWIVGDEVSDSALYGLLRRDWRPQT